MELHAKVWHFDVTWLSDYMMHRSHYLAAFPRNATGEPRGYDRTTWCRQNYERVIDWWKQGECRRWGVWQQYTGATI